MTTPTVVITADDDSTSGTIEVMAPAMVSFHMTDSTIGAGKWVNCKPEWSFGDSSGRYNDLRGFSAAHFWDIEPSENTEFTVRCTVTNVDGESAYAERTVRLLPNTRRVVYIDPDIGSASPSDPTDSNDPYNTIANAIAGELPADNIEFRFTAGKTHTWSQAVSGGNSNIICRSTVKGEKFYVIVSGIGVCMNHQNQGLLRDASFLVSGRGSEVVMLDPRSSGQSIRNCILDCVSIDPDVSITQGSDWVAGVSGSKSVLVVDTSADEIHSTIFGAGPMMTYLGVSCTHSGGERPWRCSGDHALWFRCIGIYSGANGKTAFTRSSGDWGWISECHFQNISTNASSQPLSIGHSSSGTSPDPRYMVVEKTLIIQLSTLGPGIYISPEAQGVEQCVIRNCIILNGNIQIGALNTPYITDDIAAYHNTIIRPEKTSHINIRTNYDNVIISNNLSVGYPTGTASPEILNVVDTTTATVLIANNVMAVTDLNKDVRRDGSSTRISWATWNALGYGSGNKSKTVTLAGEYRPENTEDSDILVPSISDMSQFAEDYYGNTRSGSSWVAGAVGVDMAEKLYYILQSNSLFYIIKES